MKNYSHWQEHGEIRIMIHSWQHKKSASIVEEIGDIPQIKRRIEN